MYVKEDPQSNLADIPFAQDIFNPNHELLQLSDAIDWNSLLVGLEQFYSPDKGRPSTPLRAQSATLMLKHLKNLPDRAVVHYVEESIYAQRFCNLTPSQALDYMDPANGLTCFRAKIGPKGMALIQQALNSAAHGKFRKKGGKFIFDTTCIPLDIIYPTDIKLLERCRKQIMRLFKEAKNMGLKVFYRTYNRTARKIFVTFSKLGKPKEKTRKRVHKQMFQFVRRNLKQLMDLKQRATRELGHHCRSNLEILGFLKELKVIEIRIRTILHQQNLARRGLKSIPNRIVSFHKDHVRPIVRGKFPISTEFGPKVLLGLVKGSLRLIDGFHNNVADATMIVHALRWFKTTFGHLPKEANADRGFYSRWRARFIKAMGITSGLQQRGKVIQTSSAQRRMLRQRLAIEAFISLGKRKFGWNKCLARIPEHEFSWIGMGAAAMNAHRAFIMEHPP